ncbi:NB-ARC domain-containing protein [Amycolatopsis tolypomycina]|uniref:NB-ARC domain-containing protein n=1 Tax=Amycolatopsis tolypomycina TaxID=208445 RepID=A0A1H4TZW1_9PSEU|nr:helix-turn-helix transcriptional regulator [Amycolatopsis tolypomycina]SEC61571.1 NB-ARC domain-containing protein [Amycolatopsis tolypomycina]
MFESSESFRVELRRLRIKSGVTQEELAEASGISVRAISDLERGRTRRPQRKTVELLASGMRLDEHDTARLVQVARKSTLQVALPHAVPGVVPCGHDAARSEPGEPGRICELPPRLPGLHTTLPEYPVLDDFLQSVAAAETVAPANGNTALVIGSPWVGKTTAAVHAAYKWRHLFPDGQLFIDLSPDGQPAMLPLDVVRRLSRSVGAPVVEDGAGLESAAATLRSFLASRRLLIVLDKVVSEAQVRAVLPGVSASAVIAVCRRRFPAQAGLPTVVVEPLSAGLSVALLAAALGEQRVRAEYDAAIGLATLCGGLPLALQWVSGKLLRNPHWTLHRMFTALINPQTRKDLIGACRMDFSGRFYALYDELSPDAQRALCALSHIHAEEFTVDMAAAVLGTSVDTAEHMIEYLMEWQIIEVHHDAARPAAFRINPFVRAFAVSVSETSDPLADLEHVRQRATTVVGAKV